MINKANEVLDKTPEMLPVLKNAGVVDAGGKGLICIFDGMLHALKTNTVIELVEGGNQAEDQSSVREYFYYRRHYLWLLYRVFYKDNKIDLESYKNNLSNMGDSLGCCRWRRNCKGSYTYKQPG